jgi:hypothetical protein
LFLLYQHGILVSCDINKDIQIGDTGTPVGFEHHGKVRLTFAHIYNKLNN